MKMVKYFRLENGNAGICHFFMTYISLRGLKERVKKSLKSHVEINMQFFARTIFSACLLVHLCINVSIINRYICKRIHFLVYMYFSILSNILYLLLANKNLT